MRNYGKKPKTLIHNSCFLIRFLMIPLPVKIKAVSETDTVGVFEVEGLYPGYGQTIGNSMRRVLLSSLEGAVATSVKIEGVGHEFSTIEGVKEDVVELILNLKQMRFQLLEPGPFRISLSVKGEREVTGRDFDAPSQVRVVSPEVYIATLTSKKSVLKLEIEVESGLGFVPVEGRTREKVEIGTIALDAAFTPVRKVNYEVENMRVGDQTDYNRVRFTIETDGSVSPREALVKAARILVEQFGAMTNEIEEPAGGRGRAHGEMEVETRDTEAQAESADVMKTKLEDLKISSRTLNALREGGVKTVAGLARKREESLREIEGIGDKAIQEVKKALGNLGMTLKQ